MRFKPGQKVVCISKRNWYHTETGQINLNSPKYNEIVTVHSEDPDHAGFISFYEYDHSEDGDSFSEEDFEPLMDITELTEILEQQPEHA